MGEIVILIRYRVHFIIEHENLVLDPSNNISLVILLEGKLFFKLRVGAQIACSLAQLTSGTKVFTLLIIVSVPFITQLGLQKKVL